MSSFKKVLIGLGIAISMAIAAMIWFVMSLFAEPDLSKAPEYYPFKSEKAKESYLSYYDKRAQEWPVDAESRFVETSYGSTFMRISGPKTAPPLVLLPSTNSNSLIWTTNVAALSEHYRVFALDNIYDVGRSVNTRNIRDAKDMTEWLDEVFTKLDLGNNINLMGLSFGGWLTSQYLLNHPERLDTAVLLAPVATVIQIPGEWAWRGILSALPHRYFMKKFMVAWLFADLMKQEDAASMALLDQCVEDAMMSLKSYTFRMPITPTVLTDSEIQEIEVPTLFLVGENEKLYAAVEAVNRFNRLAPQIQTEIIPDAGHDLTIVQADRVNNKILEFLGKRNPEISELH